MPSPSNNNVGEERLAVLVGKAPSNPPGSDRKSGYIIADMTVDLLLSWNCSDYL